MSNNDNKTFNDTSLKINELDVSNFINLLDQYVSDRDWIQQALIRLRLELQEEINLNIKLKELQPDETGFLVNKVQDFINKYQTELINTENELQQILTQLQQLIIENENLMNSNNALKEQLIQLNTSGIDIKITNIRTLINNNIKLLKDNNRWGDTSDQFYKFNTNISNVDNNKVITQKQHNEKEGHYSALYLDGNTWFYLGDLGDENPFPLENKTRTLCFWAKQDDDVNINSETGIFGWGSAEPEHNKEILPFNSFGARCISDGRVYLHTGQSDGITTLGMQGMGSMHLKGTGWHHYCWVFNENGGIDYYYDSNIIGSHNTIWTHNKKHQTINTILDYTQNAGLYLGCNVGEKESSKFKGYISEIAVFDKKISHHEIYQIYKAPSEHKDLLSLHNNEDFSKMVYYNRLIKTLDGANTGINNFITNSNPLILQSGTYQTVSTDLMNH